MTAGFPRAGARRAPLQEACGAARREFSFGGHRPPLQRRKSCLAYFFFDFLVPDFFPPEDLDADDFFALLPESDFDLAFPDFEAEDFLAPLPFLDGWTCEEPPPLGAAPPPPPLPPEDGGRGEV